MTSIPDRGVVILAALTLLETFEYVIVVLSDTLFKLYMFTVTALVTVLYSM
jgi:hypothetical protein